MIHLELDTWQERLLDRSDAALEQYRNTEPQVWVGLRSLIRRLEGRPQEDARPVNRLAAGRR